MSTDYRVGDTITIDGVHVVLRSFRKTTLGGGEYEIVAQRVPIHRPYKGKELCQLVGKVIRLRDTDMEFQVLAACPNDNTVYLPDEEWVNATWLFEKFVYLNGQRVGEED